MKTSVKTNALLAIALLPSLALAACGREARQLSNTVVAVATATPAGVIKPAVQGKGPEVIEKIEKTDAEWKKLLTPDQYQVLRKHGTERAGTGEYNENHRKGVYVCAACGLTLFSSDAKFDSGTGWPSFFQPIDPTHVGTEVDSSLFSTRIEVHCARCGGPLGHVFPDGPRPTGQRYCMNSDSLKFVEAK
jgi:peptide-methionine (R)-S-oxide reductase